MSCLHITSVKMLTVRFGCAILLMLCAPMFASASCPNIVTRQQWHARSAVGRQSLTQNPPPFVVIHHSDGASCTSTARCKSLVAGIQTDHMNRRKWKDIGYNFLIGGDGNVYEGRGWGAYGSHHPGYNSKSIGICMLGDFTSSKPPTAQLTALQDLIDCGVSRGEIATDYHLIGHRQGRATSCPGNALFNEIKTWANFDSSIATNN